MHQSFAAMHLGQVAPVIYWTWGYQLKQLGNWDVGSRQRFIHI